MKRLSHRFTLASCAAATLLFAGTAVAGTSEARLRYQQERAVCMSGASNQDRATCLKEAGAALQEARRGKLSASESQLGRNRTMRCYTLPVQDRQDCELRMSGAGSTSGSAQQGGILRELTRPVPAN